MCGIMGYVGDQEASEILLEGLQKLEYRGYDSAGIAVCEGEGVVVERAKGKLALLRKKIQGKTLTGGTGIGHTRWATHGRPSDENAHPHRSKDVVVVHNGIIENHLELRRMLEGKGFAFESETDTEIIPNLIELYMRDCNSLEDAVYRSIRELEGAFAVAILSRRDPDRLVVAKNSSPLILGVGEDENFIASDIPALLSHTRDVIPLEDGEVAIITKQNIKITDFKGTEIKRKPTRITWSRVMAEKDGYKHFMLKEIFEQPRALVDTLRARVLEVPKEIVLDDINFTKDDFKKIERICLVACGTSWHASLVAKYWFEQFSRIPVEVDLASEFRYRDPILSSNVLFICISQSGETADTLAALGEAKRKGARILSICNVIDSTVARKSDDVLYTHAGPEIGVASTKAFTTQLAALLILALYFGRRRGVVDNDEYANVLHTLVHLPTAVEECLQVNDRVKKLAEKYSHAKDFLLGRGTSFPIALEGALKLKEISYIHAEGYAGGEMKHGPIALIDEKMPVIALASGGKSYEKIMSNIEEAKARGAMVIAVVTAGNEVIVDRADDVIEIPKVNDIIRPIVESIPLQLFAYHVADHRGTDVDQPRNLAKSVTVE